MKNAASRLSVFSLLAAITLVSRAQGLPLPPPPPPGPAGDPAQMDRRWHDMSPEQRQQWRDERRQRRDARRQMSPEERHQLRRDIRDAGQALYPPAGHRGRE